MVEFYKALLAAQQELPVNLLKEASGQRSKYADLPSMLAVVRPVLNKHGLLLNQQVRGDVMVTALTHAESGQGEEYLFPFMADDNRLAGAQALGSGSSYSRRYGLMAALALGQDDDDGAAASAGTAKPAPAKHTVPSKADWDRLKEAAKAAGLDTKQVTAIARDLDIKGKLTEMTMNEFHGLEAKVKETTEDLG